MNSATDNRDVRDITVTRLIAAPRAVVWQAWIDPQHLAKWWGPDGFTNPVCEVDARPGGAIHIVMRAPDGTDYPMRGIYRELVAPQRLVFNSWPVGNDGQPLIDGLTTVTFSEEQGGTKLTVHTRAVALVEAASRMLDHMEAGWTQSLTCLQQQQAGRC
ncbi:SRPBCC domain-containing protein [Bradyrhizobium prioriisuperbiae]|uniref:SRPBCC family protein n=1 Tax=Bradyrhizobium prioriisuperbiae TaxID=2854389 RepID=UPI0028E25597|nr:SRPBCC domain-containing protein [Bradyrhizobium prioritasuperba]